MAPSRRVSNGRSPLVNQQRQITAFFPHGKSPITPSPSISFKDSPSSGTSSNPSPLSETKQKKPLLVVGPSPVCCSPNAAPLPESRKKLYSAEVVGKRIKVYWPLDKCWYDGCVKSFDEKTDKHVVQYDDAEEEVLDLREEKIEWVEEAARSLRRLRRTSVSVKPLAVEKEAADGGNGGDKDNSDSSGDDDSMDEDWEKNGEEEVEGDDEDGNDLVVELDEDADEVERLRASPVGKSASRKRKSFEEGKLSSGKKSRVGENVEKNVLKVLMDSSGSKADQLAASNAERGSIILGSASILTVDAAERFGKRETEKLGFLGSKRKDAAGRLPGDLNYDPRTLFLPPSFLKSLSGGQRQWWEFKSKHMDKVLLFKMGKFYELFEMDAHIGTKELDLQYMKGEQPHCGFPEKNFAMNVEKLARKGYRVLVVEQTETPEQLELRRKETGSKDKAVKREICAVVTKGTLTEGEMLSMNPDSSYLMSLTESCYSSGTKEENVILGVCFVDVSTSRFIIGQFADDAERHCLSSILSELRPVEIIKPARVLSSESQRVVQQHTRNPVINDLVPLTEFWDAEKTVQEVTKVYKVFKNEKVPGSPNDAAVDSASNSGIVKNESRCLPDVLSELVNAGENGTYALSALGSCLFYLRQAFLDESLLKFAKFELLPCSGLINALQKPYLVLDSAALENLEILENNINGGSSGSLFSMLDHCVTAFGKRLLKSWLARPLYHRESIVERQDAIASLKGVALTSALDFRKELSRLPDMERLLARLFASSNTNGRNADRVILYEDASRKLLKEFLSALRGCELMARVCSSLSTILDNTDSNLLHQLLTPGKRLPDVCSNLKHFKDAFDWSEADSSGRIVPHEGVDKEYDFACKVVEDVKLGLSNHLKDQRKLLGDKSVKYVTVGKDEYLLEVPEILQAKIPRDYELQSSKKGYFRYWTSKIKKYLAELSQAEDEKESKLKSILQRLIGHFCEQHTKWRQLVSATAELDALSSLAVASDYYEGPTCRPTIIDISCSSEASPSLAAKNLGHPVLRTESLGKCPFVLNDVNIGGAECPGFILLTGPNMGGKSTLLRQICLAVILAQIGADVPAECFELSPVDRIFVRMGARDHIMAGQSTFLTELSETATMLLSATNNSLVALDELGRGTSTSDGQAIAESVLQHFVSKMRCRGIFSTHYHRLAVDYEKDPQVSLCHMACHVGRGVGGVEEVTFLYKLTPGACPKSYGVNVARLAGLPASVLLKASAKSSEFEAAYVRNGQRSKQERYISGGARKAIQDVLHTLIASDYSESMCMELLSNMQKKVRVILKGHSSH